MRCRDCVNYKPLGSREDWGTCFGVEVPGNRDPKDAPKCRGKYFKAR
jgi:hypothetical protein